MHRSASSPAWSGNRRRRRAPVLRRGLPGGDASAQRGSRSAASRPSCRAAGRSPATSATRRRWRVSSTTCARRSAHPGSWSTTQWRVLRHVSRRRPGRARAELPGQRRRAAPSGARPGPRHDRARRGRARRHGQHVRAARQAGLRCLRTHEGGPADPGAVDRARGRPEGRARRLRRDRRRHRRPMDTTGCSAAAPTTSSSSHGPSRRRSGASRTRIARPGRSTSSCGRSARRGDR